MRGFTEEDGVFVAEFDAVEREVVGQLAADVGILLGASPRRMAEPFAGMRPGDDPWRSPPDEVDSVLDQIASPAAAPATPTDSAELRLLPAASEEAEVAEEFRRLTETDLRRTKIERLRALLRALHHGAERGELAVPPESAELLAAALTDLRLVLADRLEITSDEDAEELYSLVSAARPESEPVGLRLHLGTAYAALTWLQESLLEVMLRTVDRGEAP